MTQVFKFGGTSLATPELIRGAAKIIAERVQGGAKKIVVVVSAMGETTDELLELADKVSPNIHSENRAKREIDMLLTAGERISMSLLSIALKDLGVEAISFTGSQSGIITNEVHGNAEILEIKPFRIEEVLNQQKVAIVAGFQGVSTQKEITTLGRGGSDTTAVAVANALGAECVVFYKDVDGFYDLDPRKVTNAKLLKSMNYNEALKLCEAGANILHPRAIELAKKSQRKIEIWNVFTNQKGTEIQ